MSESISRGSDSSNARSLPRRVQEWVFERNFQLMMALSLSLPQALLIHVVQQYQRLAILTRQSVNKTINDSPEMNYLSSFSRYCLLNLGEWTHDDTFVMVIMLLLFQIGVILCWLLPLKGMANSVLSKIVITIGQGLLAMPCIVVSSNLITEGVDLFLTVPLFLFTIVNEVIREALQFDCSFANQNKNVLVRIPRPLAPKLSQLILAALFPALSKLIPSTAFVLYVVAALILCLYQWIEYLRKFVYFNQFFMSLKGVTLSVAISTYICYLTIYIIYNAILAQNVLLFITTFSVFLGNFFVVFRKSIIKDTIIDKDLREDNATALYCLFYWHCYTSVTEKKNELYLSSLLKKHLNDCTDVACCCRNRQFLYDHTLKIYGDPKIHPHLDKIFIRHYIKRLLNEGHQRFPKSTAITFLLGIYNVEVVEMITQTVELTRKLSKMQQKKQLSLTEEYLLFCLRTRTAASILEINFKRGTQNLQDVKQFDELMLQINEQLRQSVKLYYCLWKQLRQSSFKEKQMYEVCRQALQLMFSVQQTYKSLRQINEESSELRTLMLFYSKLVLHDIHLLSQVKKNIRVSRERLNLVSTMEGNTIQLFSPKTVTMIISETSRVKWYSKNTPQIFEYRKEHFHGLTIHQLMPKYFAERHDEYINRWKQTGHHIKLNRTTMSWGSTQDGHVFSALLFSKVIPLLHQQEYAFFTTMEKVDDKSEVICSEFGEVYGVGKNFTKALGISAKAIQQTRPNIQIFFPSSFEYFLPYFYPKLSSLKNNKRSFEVRREAFIPSDFEKTLHEVKKERAIFGRKFDEAVDNYNSEYMNWIRRRMQELTCDINGEYVSFMVAPVKVRVFERDKRDIVVLRMNLPRKDDLQSYYGGLEATITRLQAIEEEHIQNSKFKKTMRREKQDFFRAFLNPKKVKRILEEEYKGENSNEGDETPKPLEEQQSRRSRFLSSYTGVKSKSHKNDNNRPVLKMMEHRRRLARGAQAEIRNERVRYNLWRIKNILKEEGVISRYTYDLLIGKHHHAEHYQPIGGDDADYIYQETHKTLMDIPEQHATETDEEMRSEDAASQNELAANKEEDNETFNSASSSATFISMTNHVKLFKLKLRSLNTPLPLWVLNIVLLVILATMLMGVVVTTVTNSTNLDVAVTVFEKDIGTTLLLDQLMLCQFNTVSLGQQPNSTFFLRQKEVLLANASAIFASEMIARAEVRKIDKSILGYLRDPVGDGSPLTLREYILRVQGEIITDQFVYDLAKFTAATSTMVRQAEENLFIRAIKDNITLMFTACISAAALLLVAILPIVHKVCIKITEIYGLLGKVSQNERSRYYSHFSSLYDQTRSLEYLQQKEAENMLAKQEARARALKNKRAQSGEEEGRRINGGGMREHQQAQEGQEAGGDESGSGPYCRIISVYLVLLASILFSYFFLTLNHGRYEHINHLFTRVYIHKQEMTLRIVQANYELMGYPNTTLSNHTQVQLVDSIYNSYHIKGVSQDYQEYVRVLTYGQVCDQLSNSTVEETSLCPTLNNASLTQGLLDNLYYTQRKMEARVREYYQANNHTLNSGSNVSFPAYFDSQEFFELNQGYFLTSMLLYRLFDLCLIQIKNFAEDFRSTLLIALWVSMGLLILFLGLWLWVYFSLAESASYVNAFLLLIPFEVLSENPYIKLYIRQEFDYKAANY